MSRAGSPGGRFDARYEARSVSDGSRDDLQSPFGQTIDWWVYDAANTVVDPIYDTGESGVGGRVWKGPYRLPVISAHQIQGRTPQMNEPGFFNADRLRVLLHTDTVRQVGIKWADTEPDKLLGDRIIWNGQVYKAESVQPRALIGHHRYLIIAVDATQIRPDELVNDPDFSHLATKEVVSANPIHLWASSSAKRPAHPTAPALVPGPYTYPSTSTFPSTGS